MAKPLNEVRSWLSTPCLHPVADSTKLVVKTVRNLATVGWNAHRLRPTALGVHFVLCGYLGKLDDIPTDCLVRSGNTATEIARFEGSYKNFEKDDFHSSR